MKLTELKKSDFEEILQYYDLGEYIINRHNKRAFGNSVFSLRTTKGKYLLKIYETSDYDFIKFQAKLINYCEKKGIPSPKIIKTKNDKDVLLLNNNKITIQEFVEGSHPTKLSKNLIKEIAYWQSKLISEFKKIKLTGKYVWETETKLKEKKFFQDQVGKLSLRAEERNIIREIKKLDSKKLPQSVVHGDLHIYNLLVKNNKLQAIIDWDDAHEGCIYHEFAIMIESAFIHKDVIDKDKIAYYMKEMQSYLQINQEEKIAIYYTVKRRILWSLNWFVRQKEIHTDREEFFQKMLDGFLTEYQEFSKVSLEEFLELTNK